LADTHIFLPAESGEVERHARRALELDDRLAEAHASLGFVQMFHQWNWDEAGKRLRRAVELNSSYPTARQWYAIYLACQGRHSESVAQMEEAVKLDPLSPELQADLGQMYFFAGDDARAVAACERALELNARHGWARLYLFYIHAKAGRQEEAASAYLQFLTAVRSGSQYGDVLMGHRTGGLRGLLERDIDYFARVSKNPESFNRIAENYAVLGDRERALYWLERSVEARNFFMPFIRVNPLFSELRGDPRYETLVRRVGLME
jgi:tetratricopeptide (TPR) repeat protein